jgi:16S rRNA (guanine527-N7)-methyltransferase
LSEPTVPAIGSAIGLALDAGQVDRLERFVDLLLRWNAVYNLTAVRDRSGILVQHIADSLAVVPALAGLPAAARVLDVGSGGGLPGVVWAIARPDLRVTCLDAVAKKATFVRQAAGTLSLPNLTAVHARVEAHTAECYDLVASRAFASLADFVTWTRDLVAPGGCWLAMKGRVPHDEIRSLPPAVEMFHVEPLQVPFLDAERCIVWMRPAVSALRSSDP